MLVSQNKLTALKSHSSTIYAEDANVKYSFTAANRFNDHFCKQPQNLSRFARI